MGQPKRKVLQEQGKNVPIFETDNVALNYEIRGTGQPLLMIAGTASDGASWAPLVPLLENRFRLILIDNRGSGQTRHSGPIRFDDMVDDCSALLDHLGISKTAVIGHSLGGFIGLALAARHPDSVSTLVTMGSGASAKSLTLLGDLATLYESDVPAELYFRLLFQFLFSAPFFADPTNIEAATRASMDYPFRQSPADFRRQIEMFDTMGPLDAAAIAAPVLAISGGADLLASPEDVARTHAGITTLKTVTIPDIGHSTHWEAPDRVAELVTTFLNAD